MRRLLKLAMIFLRCIPAFFRSRSKQAIVEFALRQQLATFAEKGRRPRDVRIPELGQFPRPTTQYPKLSPQSEPPRWPAETNDHLGSNVP